MSTNPNFALQAKRAWFENVRTKQHTFRKIVDLLIKDDRTLRDDERDDFLETWDRAAFGMGVHQPVKAAGKDYYIKYPSLHSFVYDMSYYDGATFKDYEGKESNVGPSVLWLVVRHHMWQTFGWAQDRATSMSPERIPTHVLRAGHIRKGESTGGTSE